MRRFALIPIVLAFVACGDDKPGPDTTDTDTVQPDTTDTADTEDPADTDDTTDTEDTADTADTDVTPSLTGCLIAPTELLSPPGDTLPCELIPPGLTL